MAARSVLTVTTSPAFGAGLADAGFESVDNTNGDEFDNNGNTVLLVSNGSGGPLTVTITTPAGIRSVNEIVTKSLVVADGDVGFAGPFPQAIFNQTTGRVYLDWSTGTTVTAAVVKMDATPAG